jgi:uncharacterized protein YbaP (TraB family)
MNQANRTGMIAGLLKLLLSAAAQARFTALVIAIFAGSSLSAGADSDNTSVWVVSKDGEQVYIGGTVHLLRPSDFPLPAPYEEAYQASDKLYFETDISGMSNMSTQARMLQQLTYQDDRTLGSVLNAEAYAALQAYMQETGLPLAMVQKFKPGLLVSTLTVLEMQKLGFTPQGVDAYFNTRAMGDGKPVGQLESIEDQIGFMANMGEGQESEFILVSLQDLKKTEMLEEMIAAWRSGDNEQLSEVFVDDMKQQSAELYEAILVSRNRNWMPIIEEMFTQDGTEFVLVGTAHLVGEDGLLALLTDKGYEVSRP